MQKTKEQLSKKFEKLSTLATAIKLEFKGKGIVIPTLTKEGNTQIGNYIIKKQNGAFYIYDIKNREVAGPINLARTALVTANDLALGKWVDSELLNNDKWYGYKSFEEQASTLRATRALQQNDIERYDLSASKATNALSAKLYYKQSIDSRYTKLRTLR